MDNDNNTEMREKERAQRLGVGLNESGLQILVNSLPIHRQARPQPNLNGPPTPINIIMTELSCPYFISTLCLWTFLYVQSFSLCSGFSLLWSRFYFWFQNFVVQMPTNSTTQLNTQSFIRVMSTLIQSVSCSINRSISL